MIPPSPTEFSGLDCLSTGALVLDADDRILYVNPAAETLLGVSGALLVGDNADHVFERSPELRAAIRTARSEQETVIEYELDAAVSGHPPIRLGCSISPLDTPLHAVLIEMRAVDPQLRIARLEQARLQQEANRELLRNLAHEIKNPLGGLRGAAQLLERELPDKSLQEYTRIVIREADRLRNLVDRMIGPNTLLDMQPANIHQIFEHVRSLILAETPAGIRIERDYDPSLPEFPGDSEQLIQAVLNIARNAAQALGGDGVITLRSRSERQFTLGQKRHRLVLHAEIEDNGPGIPEELRERIFFPLVTGRADGTGLGLSIAQTVVHQHGGVIECHSRPGRTIFRIYLPLENGHD